MKNKNIITYVLLFISIIFLLFMPLIGEKNFSIINFFSSKNLSQSEVFVLYKIRIPQSMIAFLIGFILAIVGFIFQTIFHNDLAGPYILGISSGSAFGVVLSITFSLSFNFFIFSANFLFAFVFGILTILILFSINNFFIEFSYNKLILTGVAINIFFSSIILLLHYFNDLSGNFEIQRWLMGSIDIIGYKNFIFLLLFSVLIFLILFFYKKELKILFLQKDMAISKGVNVNKLSIVLILLSSILIALSVSMAGPISFIGLISPHIAKLIAGKNNKDILFISGLIGGILLLLSFTISRIIFYPMILPIGIVTGIIGAPFFVYLLYKKN